MSAVNLINVILQPTLDNGECGISRLQTKRTNYCIALHFVNDDC